MTELPEQPKVFPYLTIVNERHPKQKMHATLVHAKNAFSANWAARSLHRTGQLFEWVGDSWDLLYDVPAQTQTYVERTRYGDRLRYRDTRPWKAEE
jgi:hypothetical protein